MIDFTEIKDILPEFPGILILKLEKLEDGQLRVGYAPRYKSGKEEKLIEPLILTGPPEALNVEFAHHVTECVPFEKLLGNTEKIAERKKKLQEKTVAGKGKDQGKADEGGLFSKDNRMSKAEREKAEAAAKGGKE